MNPEMQPEIQADEKPSYGFGSTHLVVAVPACGRLTTVRWGINLAAQKYPMNMAADFCSAEDGKETEVGLARNCMVEYALQAKAKLIWMLDDDVLPPDYAVQRLLHAMLNKPDVIACAGIYYSKQDVAEPVVFEDNGSGAFTDWKPGEVFEVPGFIGTGCMLIKTKVFESIEPPWFQTLEYPDRVTDDAFFCRKVRAAGFKILGHGGVLCGHFNARTKKTIWPAEVAPLEQPVLVR